MPDALVVSMDPGALTQLESVVRASSLRPKTCLDMATALEWLRLRTFSVVIVDETISVGDQQKLGGLLWERSPVAPLYYVQITGNTKKSGERLFGAEPLWGPCALEELAHHLSDLAREDESQPPSSLNVMVVEDLDAPRDIICSYVESLGYAVVKDERSAIDALRSLETEPSAFSCIITDIRMPDMNGKQLIECVRQHPKLQHLPIIVLTAYGTADMLIECLKAGASGFLAKPPKRSDLIRELARAQRIVRRGQSPRLASGDEVEGLREALVERGFYEI